MKNEKNKKGVLKNITRDLSQLNTLCLRITHVIFANITRVI